MKVQIPGWAGYKSLVSPGQSVTRVGALLLLPEVAHEWPTMLTVMLQASQLKKLVVGQDHPTVITFDMALYYKAVQLLDARPNLKNEIVPRLGEQRTVMAALRALGTSIENSGIDDAWIEAAVCGPSTTRQILKCSHYKRALCAHIHTYMALYELALEQFFREMPHLKEVCLSPTKELQEACINMASDGSECIRVANTSLLQVLNARQRLFLASPEMSCLSTEFKGQFELQMNKPEGQNDLQPSVIRQQHHAVDKIKAAILSHGNPFTVEGNQLYNFITNAYVPQEYIPQILNADEIGQKLHEDYVAERINGDISLWAPVKKQNNKMYMSGSKKLTVKIRDQTVDLKETKTCTVV